MAQVLPSPAASPAPAAAMEEDVDACLAGDSVVDPVVVEESVPAFAVAEPHAAPALMDEDSAPPQAVVVDENAASQDCPSLPFSSQQSEESLDLFSALESIQNDSLALLQDDGSDVGAFSTCTSFSDQLGADQLQELLLSELPSGSLDSDGDPNVPEC